MEYMNKMFIFSILTASLLAVKKPDYVKLISSDIQTTTIEFNLDDFILVPVQTADGVMYMARFENGASFLKAGAPDIQKFSSSIIIPDDAEMKLEILSSEFTEYEDISIAPSKGNLSRLINPNNLPYEFGIEYSQDAFFPPNIADLQKPYILKNIRGITIDFHPIQYNPINKSLRIYQQIIVEVTTGSIGETNVLNRKVGEQLIAREFKHIYESHFLNFSSDYRFDYLDDNGNMLIISYGAFMEEMQPLVDWKNRKGVSTEMVNVSEIGTNSNTIQNYVDNYYYENGLTFLLLIGDAAQIPSPSISGSASDPSYGFIEGEDSYAEVIVGRFSGSTPAHIATQVERSIDYERSPQDGGDWYDNAMGVASTQGTGFGGYDDDEFQDFLWETVLSPFTYDNYQYSYDGSGSVSQGMGVINNGVSIINYTGHGYQSGWGNGAALSTSNVNSLTNDNMLPFVISVACNVGEFNTTNECFAEAWLRATNNGEPTGGIGHIGSTISQSWEPPMHGQYGMNLILTESYEGHITRSMGGIATNGCMYMNDAQGSNGIYETNYWTLFGDPSLELRTDQPSFLNISHDDAIIVGQTELIINTGIDNALVALSYNNELLTFGYSENGNAHLNLEDVDLLPGDYDLVITSFNSFPYEGTISVITPEGPYVSLYSHEIVSDNNNNGLADFDEHITLTLQANNVGVDAAENVYATVSIDDPYINLFVSNVSFGDISEGEVVNSTSNIEFDIAHDVPDGYNAGFDILFFSDENQWEGNFNITIHAPILTVSNPSFIDTNGDAVWDAGEEITIVLLLNNEGSADHFNYPGVGLMEYSTDAQIPDDGEYFWLYGIIAGESTPVEFSVTASEDANMGTEVTFTAQATEMNCEENCIESESLSFTFTIGLPFDESLNEPLNLVAEAGESSIDLNWDEPFTCPDGQFADCIGQCIDEWYEVWIGDGLCDDGTWGVYFNCDEFDNDGGDCGGRDNNFENKNVEKMFPNQLIADLSDAIIIPANARDAEGYFVYRDGIFITYTEELGYSDSDINAGMEYCYHITAVYEEGQSGPSNTACAMSESEPGIMGDLNGDEVLNILDIIILANMALGTQEADLNLADLNGDGIINVLDIITLVNMVLNGRSLHVGDYLSNNATIYEYENSLFISADGPIAGIQISVIAENLLINEDIPLTIDTYYVNGEHRVLIYGLSGETLPSDKLRIFSADANYNIKSMIIANVLGQSLDLERSNIPLLEVFKLSQNFPNPFNPNTSIQFILGQDELVSLNIFDIQGRLINSLIHNTYYPSGYHNISWDGTNTIGTHVPSGMYIYKLIGENQTLTKKMVLMK